MNKKAVLWTILVSLFIVVYDVIYFASGAGAWIAWVFIHIAFALVIATPILLKQFSGRRLLFSVPVTIMADVYFFVAFGFGIIFSLLGKDSFKASLVVQILIMALYAIILVIALLLSDDGIVSADFKGLTSRIKDLREKTEDEELRKTIDKLYDLFHDAPQKSTASVKKLDNRISKKVSAIEQAFEEEDELTLQKEMKDVKALVKERNDILRLSK